MKKIATDFEDIFGRRCARVIEAFLEAEALCYAKNIDKEVPYSRGIKPMMLSLDGEDWVKSISDNIIKEINKTEGAQWYRFISMDNTKTIHNQLIMIGQEDFYKPIGGTVDIVLCICGQLSCWGKVIVNKRKEE